MITVPYIKHRKISMKTSLFKSSLLHSDYLEIQLKTPRYEVRGGTPGCKESIHDQYRHLHADPWM